MTVQPTPKDTPKGAWKITFLLFLFMLVNFADKIVVGLAGAREMVAGLTAHSAKRTPAFAPAFSFRPFKKSGEVQRRREIFVIERPAPRGRGGDNETSRLGRTPLY